MVHGSFAQEPAQRCRELPAAASHGRSHVRVTAHEMRQQYVLFQTHCRNIVLLPPLYLLNPRMGLPFALGCRISDPGNFGAEGFRLLNDRQVVGFGTFRQHMFDSGEPGLRVDKQGLAFDTQPFGIVPSVSL